MTLSDELKLQPFDLLVRDNVMLVKFGPLVNEEHVEQLEQLVETVDSLEMIADIYVFDLTDTEAYDLRCIHPFVVAQNNIRKKEAKKILTVIPQCPIVKKLLVGHKLLQDDEMVDCRASLVGHLKFAVDD